MIPLAAGLVLVGGCMPEPMTELDAQEAFAIRVLPSPTLVAPADGAVITEARPEFRWIGEPAAAKVEVQICDDAACAHVVVSFTGRRGVGSPPADLAPGPAFWRAAQIRGHEPRSPWSEIRRFTILGPTVDLFRPLLGTGPLVPRSRHQAVRLADGRVLVVGGASPASDTPLASAEIFSPSTESFTATGSMTVARAGHRATALDDGRVLITGGSPGSFADAVTATEIYVPALGTFVPGPDMAVARSHHTATRLADGRVLVAGGQNASGSQESSAEIFDPVTDEFSPTGAMTVTRASHEAVLLADGRVLLTGGPHPSSSSGGGRSEAELYDPSTGTFSAVGDMNLNRNFHRLARLLDGRVLVTGATLGQGIVFATAERFDPSTGVFTLTSPMNAGRLAHTMTTLTDGRVLVAGGLSDGGVFEGPTQPSDQAEAYQPAAASFVVIGATMVSPRVGHTDTLLADGKVLLVAGNAAGDAELFVPGSPGLARRARGARGR